MRMLLRGPDVLFHLQVFQAGDNVSPDDIYFFFR